MEGLIKCIALWDTVSPTVCSICILDILANAVGHLHVHLMDTTFQKFGVSERFFFFFFKETTFIQGFIELIKSVSKKAGANLQDQQDSFTALIYAGRGRERGTKAEESP